MRSHARRADGFAQVMDRRRIHGWSSLKMVQRYVHLLAIDEELEERVAG